VILGEVVGTSSTNTITFDGIDSSNRILSYNDNASGGYVFRLNGTDYVTIKNLTISNTSSISSNFNTYYTLHITNDANYNTVTNCVVRMAPGYGYYSVAIGLCGAQYYSDGRTDNNLITKSIIDGGYMPVSMNGDWSVRNVNNDVTHCTISSMYQYGIYCYYNDEANIDDNKFLYHASGGSTYAIMLGSCANFSIQRNIVKSKYYGIYVSNSGITNTTRAKINNNIVYGFTSNSMPIITYYLGTTDVFHNTVYQNTSNSYGMYMYGPTSTLSVKNNTVMNTGANSYLFYSNVGGFDMDYNNFYSTTTGNYVFMGTTNHATLNDLKTAFPTMNQNSVNTNPNFISTTSGSEDFHLVSSVPSPSGANVGVSDDVDRETRCVFAPSIGADESKFVVPPPVAGFAANQDTVFIDAPMSFLNAAAKSDPKAHTWYLDGTQMATTLNFPYTFTATGSYDVKLVTQSCGGIDSITRTIVVHNPTRVPVSDFIANKNTVEIYEDVMLTDLSVNGASGWQWSVTPNANVSFSPSSTAQNPVINFGDPGVYQVCLTASNSLGNGNVECKTAYITVNTTANMCIAPFTSNSAQGKLYDSGGPLANYGTNENCSFLIDPCASSMTLFFTKWEVLDGNDYLRIYDGTQAIASNLLGTFSNTYSNTNLPGGTSGITAPSGKMLVVWVSNGFTTYQGWTANWTSVPATFAAPVSGFDMPDTAFTGTTVNFTSTSTGLNLAYSWDLDSPNMVVGYNSGTEATESYEYSFPGTFRVKLDVTNCGGISSFSKDIVIVDPSTTPVVDFMSDLTVLTANDTAQLTDMSGQGPTYWTWSASPSSGVTFIPNNSVKNPKIKFSGTSGCYNIKLKAGNMLGEDSLEKTGYICVIGYCTPSVSTLIADLGINHVKLVGSSNTVIDNISNSGVNPYADYTAVGSAIMELGGSYDITVSRATTNNSMNRKVWIDYNADGDFTDPLEEVASESSAKTKDFTATIAVPSTVRIGATRMRIGVSQGTNANNPCGPNGYGEFEDYRVIINPDQTKPEITLTADANGFRDTIWVEQFYTYTNPGATATDNIQGNITSQIQSTTNVNTNVAGTYYETYDVTDAYGNKAAQKVRVVVVTPDITKPVVTLIGNSSIDIEVYSSYVDSGATAMDYQNIPMTAVLLSSNVDTAVVGTYTVTWFVQDVAGNVSTLVNRTVNVVDRQAPVLTLIGSDPVYVEVGTGYNDSGAVVIDNYYQNLLVLSNSINPNVIGTYTITYTVTDGSGNAAAPITRTVIVRDTQKPVITLKGDANELLDVYSAFDDKGAEVFDNYDQNLTYTRTGSVDTALLGAYQLVYYAVDGSGNIADSVVRIVNVVDREKPVLTLNGKATVNMFRWDVYTDAGVSVDDNYYGNATLDTMVKVTSTVDPLDVGIYQVCYNLTDPSGNVADEICRFVFVGAPPANGIDENDLNSSVTIYPNPNSGVFRLDISLSEPKELKIEIYNMMGALVKTVDNSKSATAVYEIDLSNNASGVYYVRVQSDDQVINRKVTISK
jgi:PKD repeat protein